MMTGNTKNSVFARNQNSKIADPQNYPSALAPGGGMQRRQFSMQKRQHDSPPTSGDQPL